MMNLNVSSEISRLQKVLIHAPDEGIARISPKRADELLFDDIVHLPQMQKEHDIFVNVLKQFIGSENVIEIENLIWEALDYSPEGRENLIRIITEFEELPKIFNRELTALSNEELAKTMISGYCPSTNTILFDPIPNFIFTRDIAVMVNDHVVITKAAKEARFRENLLTRFMFWRHPMFENIKNEGKIINLNMLEEFPPSRKGERVSVEGGDMMILNEKYLLVGCSERSTAYAFHSLKDALFAKDVIENVVMVKIPVDRSFMHIDTVFTQINHAHLLSYKPIAYDGLSSYVTVHSKNGLRREYPSIREFMLSEINSDMQFIFSGRGESPYQEREQWTDACNLLAIRPGVAISYDRNVYTERALEEFGYAILPALDFLDQCKTDPETAEHIKNTIISLPSGELSRARGGSHCMSCPIARTS
jgi:arginine deiminase